jgi:thiopeptide-type bacteriocin biosynthesis protein
MLQPFPFVLLRSPLQSLDKSYASSESIESFFEEGLYLSSPDFWEAYKKRNELSVKDTDKLWLSFNKYWVRSCMRCTPYGTFAGSMLLHLTEGKTSIELNSLDYIRSVRIDMNYLATIIQSLVELPTINCQIKFYPNNSIYELGGHYRYAEFTIHNGRRKYLLTSVKKTKYLQYLLEYAKVGMTINVLTKLLISNENVEEQVAKDFVLGMCNAQLLLPELESAVTGKDPLTQLIEKLSTYENVDGVLDTLKGVQQLLNSPTEGVSYYQQIENELNSLSLSIMAPKNTVQVDLFLSGRNNKIDQKLISSIVRQSQDLMLLTWNKSNTELQDFKTKFYSKYEEEEIPLSIALDADLGIGYSGVYEQSLGNNDLVNDLAVTGRNQTGTGGPDYLEKLAIAKYIDFLSSKKTFIELSIEDLQPFETFGNSFSFPNSMFLMGNLLKTKGMLDKENFSFFLSAFGGPSAGTLLGRFTHGNDELLQYTKEVLRKEEKDNPDVIYAEVVHLPEARIGNVLLRPLLREYEIPYIGKSGAPQQKQLTIDDLVVSIRNNEIVLRSIKHNKRIIPRLTSAHNFVYKSLPIYKFLCDLQAQNNATPAIWNWGSLSRLNFLPRVVYKNIILKKARWIVVENDLKQKVDNNDQYDFDSLLERLSMPERVVYIEGDNQLMIDFNEHVGRDLFLHYLKRHKKITVEEFLFEQDNCIVKDVNNLPFTNELIIPVHNDHSISYSISKMHNLNDVQRKFAPGSQWLYFKIYCGSKTAEKILSQVIFPFVEEQRQEGLFEKFFFIRYKDEFSHIRIRFFNSKSENQSELQQLFLNLMNPMIIDGLITKVSIDTYSRELERYDSNLIEETESLFFNDSICVLRFINLLDIIEDSDKYRLLFAMRGVDMLLDDFGFLLAEKKELLRKLQTSFFREFGGSLLLQKQLNEKYRKYQKDIFTHLNQCDDEKNEITEAVEMFAKRSCKNKTVIESILTKIGMDNKEMLFRLLPSYMHMFINRLFVSQQRRYELLVYHFLEKYYTSKFAISEKENPKNTLIRLN